MQLQLTRRTASWLMKMSFLVLEDDQNFWPPYNLVTVLNQELLKENPDIGDILDKVDATLTTEKMIELNAMVDIDGREYQDVATEFYEILK